jgi:hypothetical protein
MPNRNIRNWVHAIQHLQRAGQWRDLKRDNTSQLVDWHAFDERRIDAHLRRMGWNLENLG